MYRKYGGREGRWYSVEGCGEGGEIRAGGAVIRGIRREGTRALYCSMHACARSGRFARELGIGEFMFLARKCLICCGGRTVT